MSEHGFVEVRQEILADGGSMGARRNTRHKPAISTPANAWPPARVAAFWARRHRIFMRACEDAELVAEALRIVGRSEVHARLRGGVPVCLMDALIDLYVHAHYDRFSGGR
ncbi:hypothetical protein, partial [Burkholderia gladioli]|uniref:hypothetical protein n=1 Tax=Burkholderia gladioli TaxID=28095 RepID=UPI0034DB5DE3